MVFHSQHSMLRFFEVKVRVDKSLLRKGMPAAQASDVSRNQAEGAVLRARDFRAQQRASQAANPKKVAR